MAIAMTKRERVFLVLTIVLGVFALLYHFGLQTGLGSFSQEREKLRLEKKHYEDYIRTLKREPLVNRRYQALESRYPPQRVKEFTADIERALKSFRMTNIVIDPPVEDFIEGTQEYGLVTLHVRCEGNTNNVSRMLGYFDRQAILVNELKLTSHLDSPRITVDTSISQIVKLSEEMKAKMEKRASSRDKIGRLRRREPGRI